jgi:hypothetical protein
MPSSFSSSPSFPSVSVFCIPNFILLDMSRKWKRPQCDFFRSWSSSVSSCFQESEFLKCIQHSPAFSHLGYL